MAMDRRTAQLALAAILVPLVLNGCTKAVAQTLPQEGRKVQLVVYKDDFAMVRETRSTQLEQGRNRVRLSTVSNSLDPQSVMLDFDRKDTTVVSNTYDLGVGEANSALSRLSGREVELMLPSQDGAEGQTIKGILEPSKDGGFLLRTGDKLYVNPPGTIIADSAADVATMPQLWAEIEAASAGAENLYLTYLSRGLSWSADYVGRLEGEDRMRLELWATVSNRTGIRYPEAEVSFVAGSPNRAVKAEGGAGRPYSQAGGVELDKSRDLGLSGLTVMEPAATGELYSYKAPARATIGIDQMNRVPMMESVEVPIKRDYSVSLPPLAGYGYEFYGRPEARLTAQLAISFENKKTSNLGLPLPSGGLRVYSSGSEGGAYIGAATVVDTPENAPVNVTLSKVFDVYAQPKVVATKKIDKRTVRKMVEVQLSNQKKSDVEVRLVQPLYGLSKLQSESHKSLKLDAATRQWKVHVPAGGEAKLKFEVDLRV